MTIVGRLKVKVVPDASGFQRAADRQLSRALLNLRKDLRKPSKKLGKAMAASMAAGMAGGSFVAGKQAGSQVARGVNSQMPAALQQIKRNFTKPLGKQMMQELSSQMQSNVTRSLNAQALTFSPVARRALQSQLAQVRVASSIAQARALSALNRGAVTDGTRAFSRLLNAQARGAARAMESQIARGYKLQQEQLAKDSAGMSRAAAAAGRAAGRSWANQFLGQTGRAGFRTSNALERTLAATAFAGGGPFRSIATALGLMGGKAAVAGGAVALLGSAVAGVGVAAAGLAVGAAAFGAFSAAALRSAGALQQQSIAFGTLLRSQDAGDKFFASIIDFAKNTPFDVPGVADGAKRLLAYGNTAEEVVPLLTDLGDATSALGLGTDGLNRLILAFGQIKAAGRLYRTEIRQLTEAGIPVWDILGAKLGKTKDELDAMLNSGLDASVAITALRDGMREMYGGSMQAQAKSFLGTMERINESITVGFGTSLMRSLPELSAQLRNLAPSLETVSTSLGSSLGPSLTSFIEGIEPAFRDASSVLSGLLPQVLRDWTPAYTTITNNLLNAFRDASPGIYAMSQILSNAASAASAALRPVAQVFTEVAVGIRDAGIALDALGVDEVLGGAWKVLTAGPKDNGDSLRELNVLALEFSAAMQAAFGSMALALSELLSKLPGAGGISDDLRGWADRTLGNVERVQAKAARMRLEPEVQVQLDDAENALLVLSQQAKDIPASFNVDADAIRTGSIRALSELAELPAEELLKVGINKAELQAQIGLLDTFFDGLSPEILASLNVDRAKAQAALDEIRQQAEAEWSAAVTNKSTSSLISSLAVANEAIDQTKRNLVFFDTATGTVKLLADVEPFEQKILAAENKIAIFDGITGQATLLATDDATSAIVAANEGLDLFDGASAEAVVGLDDNATSALDQVVTALMGYDGAVAIAEAGVNDAASPRIAALRAALAAWDESGGAASVDADDPAAQIIAQAQTALAEWDAAVGTGEVAAIDNASTKLSNVLGLLTQIPRYKQTTISVVTQYSAPIGPGLTGGQSLLQRSGGGSVPVDGAGPARSTVGGGLAEGGVSSMLGRAASVLPSNAAFVGRWVGDLRRMVAEVRKAAKLTADEIAEALAVSYDMEIWTRRRLQVEREQFARRQQDENAYVEAVLRNREKGVEGAALEFLRASHDAQLKQWRRQQEDKAREFDWQLEDERIFYDRQKRLAEEYVTRLQQIQDRARGTVDWSDVTNPASIIRNLRRSTDVLTQFASDLAKLQRLGLSDAAQEALEALDPTEAARIAKRLLADPNLIRELNDAYGDFLKAGIGLSARFTDPVAAAGQVVGTAFARGLSVASPAVAPVNGGSPVVVNQEIHPSPGMSERELAAAAGRELLWSL
jgi:tape measure domain-containing protein